MAQANTSQGKISTVLHNRYFTKGVQDVLAGRPFDPDYDKWDVTTHSNAQWCYERGRQYAIATGGKIPTKIGKRLNIYAMAEFARLYREGVIL